MTVLRGEVVKKVKAVQPAVFKQMDALSNQYGPRRSMNDLPFSRTSFITLTETGRAKVESNRKAFATSRKRAGSR